MEGDGTTSAQIRRMDTEFQSTPSAWRETICGYNENQFTGISIHSLRMEGDLQRGERVRTKHRISIHSLRMEGDLICISLDALTTDFNPLPPHGGRPSSTHFSGRRKKFQSTPSAWRETCNTRSSDHGRLFQSTPSAWRETKSTTGVDTWEFISIHSLRMEGDQFLPFRWVPGCNFNPLPPHGGRLFRSYPYGGIFPNFNPLPPHGGRPDAA